MNANEVWKEIKERLEKELDSDVFQNYFSSINEVYKETDALIYLLVDTYFSKSRIQNYYLSKLNSMLQKYYDSPKYFNLITKAEAEEEEKFSQEIEKPIRLDRQVFETELNNLISSNLNPKYTFDTFIVGNSNRFAHRCAMLAADQLAQVANPVFLFGDVGLGKTHLMQAIGNYIKQSRSDLKVGFMRTNDFCEQYVKCCQENKGFEEFQKSILQFDVLLVDDIQFLESKKKSQVEFVTIFEKFYADGKLIVITCDRKPKDLEIMTRLQSRFMMGSSLDINKPDKEHRINIINSKLRLLVPNSESFPSEVVDFIATVSDGNIRELEGNLTRVVYYCDAFNYEYSINSAQEALKNIKQFNDVSFSGSGEQVKRLISCVCSYFKIDQDALLSSSRKKDLVYARQICFYLLRSELDLTFQKIGDLFGGKDHSTIMHGYETIESSIKLSEETQRNVENIKRKLGKSDNEV